MLLRGRFEQPLVMTSVSNPLSISLCALALTGRWIPGAIYLWDHHTPYTLYTHTLEGNLIIDIATVIFFFWLRQCKETETTEIYSKKVKNKFHEVRNLTSFQFNPSEPWRGVTLAYLYYLNAALNDCLIVNHRHQSYVQVNSHSIDINETDKYHQ